MSSTAADGLPALPPIKITPPAPEPAACSSAASSSPDPAACSSAASSSTAPAPAPDAESVATLPSAETKQQQQERQGEAESEAQDQETEPTTPTAEGSRLRPPAECPPPPRKPAWAPPSTPAKRKFPSSAAPSARREFFPVTRDLTTVFRALPPKKQIRAG